MTKPNVSIVGNRPAVDDFNTEEAFQVLEAQLAQLRGTTEMLLNQGDTYDDTMMMVKLKRLRREFEEHSHRQKKYNNFSYTGPFSVTPDNVNRRLLIKPGTLFWGQRTFVIKPTALSFGSGILEEVTTARLDVSSLGNLQLYIDDIFNYDLTTTLVPPVGTTEYVLSIAVLYETMNKILKLYFFADTSNILTDQVNHAAGTPRPVFRYPIALFTITRDAENNRTMSLKEQWHTSGPIFTGRSV